MPQVMQAYHMSPVPQPGQEFEFCPDASLQPVHFLRSRSSEGLTARYVHGAAEAAIMAEAGEGLSSWCCAALCCSLSLENILHLLAGQRTSCLNCCTVLCEHGRSQSQLNLNCCHVLCML